MKFSCAPCEPVVIENLPFDKYELEPSPLTQHILERRQPNIAWQVINYRDAFLWRGVLCVLCFVYELTAVQEHLNHCLRLISFGW